MTNKKSGLGKGIGALIAAAEEEGKSVLEIPINDIEPGDGQPRQVFDKEKMEQLAVSIREYGVIQPLIVKKEGEIYKIIAGERRWRAARLAGLKVVPVIERNASSKEIMELALIENIQREDLNPIEEAEAYQRLIEEYAMTQEELSEKVGKSRSAITNFLRLLQFDGEIRSYLINGTLTAGHARALLALDNKEDRLKAAKEIRENDWSVRQTEQYVKKLLKSQSEQSENREEEDTVLSSVEVKRVQNSLKNALGTKVKLEDKNGKGKIVIEYYSIEERERLFDYLTKK